ncbi:hypothetical protein LP414_27520 [Polaromonas sp. P1(28)-13]|nr:hypothetical protein LP414_27520 [Polaromonas sp. P1(28)-13]
MGSEVTFHSTKRGRNVRMFVENFGPKNLLGYEIDATGNHLRNMKWRVHPSMVKLVTPTQKIATRPTGGVNDRPAGLHASMF